MATQRFLREQATSQDAVCSCSVSLPRTVLLTMVAKGSASAGVAAHAPPGGYVEVASDLEDRATSDAMRPRKASSTCRVTVPGLAGSS